MPASYIHRRATPGRAGTHPVLLTGGTDTITASATTQQVLGAAPTPGVVSKVVASAHTVPVSAAGTILATLKKYDASAAGDVTLSSALDLEALTAKVGSPFVLLSTLTPDQQTLDTGDSLRVEIVSNNAIGTAAVGLRFVAELFQQT